MNKYIYYSLIILSIISCSDISHYQKMTQFIDEKSDNKISIENYEFVIVINEMGDCINCNNRFAKLMEKHIGNKKKIFIISSNVQRIDISQYLNEYDKNIILDYHNDFGKLKITQRSAIIKLKNNSIDTIIEIETKNINDVNNVIK